MGNRQTAQQMFDAGLKALADKDKYAGSFQHAYKAFASACFADPDWSTAFYQIGNNNVDLNLGHAAVACYRRALECKPDRLERARILYNMAWQLQVLGRTEEARQLAHKAVAAAPTESKAHLNLSVIYRDLCDSHLSLCYAKDAFEIDPAPENEVALAFALLFDGQYAQGLKHFERRYEWRLHQFMNYPYPRWDGAPGKQVVIVADQGLGDTLCYSRFVRRVCEISGYVHIICQHELLRLFQHAFADIKNLNIMPGLQQSFPPADCWTTFVSLPVALGLSNQQIIDAPSIPISKWSLPKTWKVPERKLHIGIAWGGSPLNDIDRHRNIPIQLFYELYRVPGVQLYSLQVNQTMTGHDGRTVNQQSQLSDSGGSPLIVDLSPYIHDVVDTASLVDELDLVISAETALPHICAAVGKECWVPYSRLGLDYRIGLTGENRLWCPQHRIFKQGDDSQWQPVFDRIVEALNERCAKA